NVVELDVLDAIKAAFVADVPREAAGELIAVVDSGAELIGRLHVVGLLTIVTRIKGERIIGAGERGAECEGGSELRAVARLARDVDRGLEGPLPLERDELRVPPAGGPGGGNVANLRADHAVRAGNLE